MVKAELTFDIHETFPEERVEVETEVLRKPLLARAGIVDLNHAFNLLPDSTIHHLGQFPNIDGADYYPFMFDLRNEVFDALDEGEALFPEVNQHSLYPITADGFIDQIAKTRLFAREFGVPQLGLRPFYPLPNPHNRGEHSIYTTVNMVRSLQTFHDQSTESFEKRLRKDFADEAFYDPDIDGESLVNLAVDLAVVTGMEHDQATPAGGDTIKYLLKLDEEEDIEWLFAEHNPVLSEEKREFLETIKQRGLGREHLDFAIRCIQGKSDSLIGEMIHPKIGDVLDWDRMGYTLLDAQMGKMLSGELPDRLFPAQLTWFQTKALQTALSCGVEALSSNDNAVLGYVIRDPATGENYGRPSTNFIDPTEDFMLDDEGNLINTKPEKLAWVAAYRMLMTAHHYAGGKMLGFETKIQRKLGDLLAKGKGQDILNREKLITLTSDQLYRELVRLGDPELTEVLHEIDQTAGESHFSSRIIPSNEPNSDAWAAYPLKVKPGLETRVSLNGEVMTLGEYVDRNPSVVPAMIISEARERYKNQQVVIWEAKNDFPIIRTR